MRAWPRPPARGSAGPELALLLRHFERSSRHFKSKGFCIRGFMFERNQL